jgi:ubiquinone/menaquinone biosynthesis C-methylase UbiE
VNGASEPHVFKQRIREQWNEVAARWHRWTPLMREQYASATELMLDLARLGLGDRVLDVAAGDGYQSIAAAERVGSSGYVLAVDLAPEPLKYAVAAARQAGLEHFETREMDGENLQLADASFDAVVCHFGLMFFPDPDRGLREMLRVLKPGGRASLVIFAVGGTPESDLAASIIRGRLGLPTTRPALGSGGALGAPGVLKRRLENAGFRAVEVHELSVPLRLESAAEAVRYLREIHPSLEELIAPLPAEQREELWQDVERALTAFDGAEGFQSPNQVLVVAGARAIEAT